MAIPYGESLSLSFSRYTICMLDASSLSSFQVGVSCLALLTAALPAYYANDMAMVLATLLMTFTSLCADYLFIGTAAWIAGSFFSISVDGAAPAIKSAESVCNTALRNWYLIADLLPVSVVICPVRVSWLLTCTVHTGCGSEHCLSCMLLRHMVPGREARDAAG